MQGPMFFNNTFFWIESIYTLLIMLIVLFVYFKTREIYKLTDHKGIKYFSYTFLFFAISHLFKFLFRFLFKLIFMNGFFGPGRGPNRFGSFIFVYTSVMAGLFLFYSLIWKKIKLSEKKFIIISNLFAIGIVIIDLIIRNPLFHISVVTLIFFITTIVSVFGKEKKKHKFFAAYLSIFLIWILNLIFIEIPKFMIELRIGIYLISAILYFLILLRVNKVTNIKNGKKKR